MSDNSVIGTKSALVVSALAAAALITVGVLGMHSVAPLSGMSRGLKVALIAIGSTAGVLIVLSAPKAIKDRIEKNRQQDEFVKRVRNNPRYPKALRSAPKKFIRGIDPKYIGLL